MKVTDSLAVAPASVTGVALRMATKVGASMQHNCRVLHKRIDNSYVVININ